MLDDNHLTLENKILPSDKDWTMFAEYWDDKAVPAFSTVHSFLDLPPEELQNA